MPRYTMKSLLIGFAIAVLWLSSLGGHPAAGDVCRSLLLVVAAVAGVGGVFCRGRWQAFSIAFLVVVLAMTEFLTTCKPRFNWALELAREWARLLSDNPTQGHSVQSALFWSLIAAWIISFAALAGFIGAHVYDMGQRRIENDA